MGKQEIIAKLTNPKVKDFLKQYGITKLSLFGSYATGEAKRGSDVDLLYTQDKNIQLGLEFFAVVNFLEKTLRRKIDLIDRKFLNPDIKKYVLADKIDIT